jgi:pimeloyl-ACP methyl ester carboxylesterase
MLQTKDEVKLYGTCYPAVGDTPAPAVLLVHGRGQDRREWTPFAETLRQAGYAVLSIDLRGHGQSRRKANGGRIPGYRGMDSERWNEAVEDLRAAYNHLITWPEVDEESVALVGSDIGANLALNFAGGETGVKALVVLSPGREYEGVKSEDGQAHYGERPMFLAFSQDDRESADGMEEFLLLARQPEGDLLVKELERAGHGTEMLKRKQTLISDIVSWLTGILHGL